MADISTITLSGTTYNIKDSAARTSISELDDSVQDLSNEVSAAINEIEASDSGAGISYGDMGAAKYSKLKNTTYSTVSDRLNADTDQLSGDINNLTEQINVTWSKTGHINAWSGTVNSNTTYYNTSYIDCSKYTVIYQTSPIAESFGIAFYDKNYGFISGKSFSNFPVDERIKINVPYKAHYFRTSTKDITGEYGILRSFCDEFNYSLYEELDNVIFKDYYNDTLISNVICGGFTDDNIYTSKNTVLNCYADPSTGILISHNEFCCTDYLQIETEKYYCLGAYDKKNKCIFKQVIVTWYNDNKDFISGADLGNTLEIMPPVGASFVRLSIKKEYINRFYFGMNLKNKLIGNANSGITINSIYGSENFIKEQCPNISTVKSKNIFNEELLIEKSFVSQDNGHLQWHINFTTSEMIDITNHSKIFIFGCSNSTNGIAWAFYDINHEIISQRNYGSFSEGGEIQIPSGSVGFRYSIPINYSPIGIYLDESPIEKFGFGAINTQLIGLEEYIGASSSVRNLLSNIVWTDGKYVAYQDGSVVSLNSYSVTDYIEIVPGLKLNISNGSGGSQLAFYNSDKLYVSGIITANNKKNITIPVEAKFCRWCCETSKKTTARLSIATAFTNSKIITVNSSDSILEACIGAYTTGNVEKIIVKPGIYDIINEYKAYYGTTYFDDYVETYNNRVNGWFDCGIWIDGFEIEFMQGAKVLCHYEGDNSIVKRDFSAFAVGSNASIIGLVLDASEIRYGIHPDFHPDPYNEEILFKNCDLKMIKGGTFQQAIGTGFGMNTITRIEDCIFRSVYENKPVYRFHNNGNSDAQSKIIIKDCYIDGPGYFLFNAYGTSELMTDVLLSNCSYEHEPVVGKETSDSNMNVQLIAWNNELRTI